MTVLISNLSPKVSGKKLLDLLASFGTIKEMMFPLQVAGKTLNCALVKFDLKSQENLVIEQLHGLLWEGEKLTVSQANLSQSLHSRVPVIIYTAQPCF